MEKLSESECSLSSKGKDGICVSTNIAKTVGEAVGSVKTNDKDIMDDAKSKLKCNSYSCVLDKVRRKENRLANKGLTNEQISAINNELILQFKPKGPWNNDGLLNNMHIDIILSQLHEAYKTYYHIGYQMIDFFDTPQGSEFANLNLANIIKKGFNTFGVVLNTDVSTGGGEHWFCLFGDFRGQKWTLEYFNSSGNNPREPVMKWMVQQKMNIEEIFKRDVEIIKVLNYELQKDNHSCGVYCVMYQIYRVTGKSVETVLSKFDDNFMVRARAYLFRHEHDPVN
jgi:hypothetical protein